MGREPQKGEGAPKGVGNPKVGREPGCPSRARGAPKHPRAPLGIWGPERLLHALVPAVPLRDRAQSPVRLLWVLPAPIPVGLSTRGPHRHHPKHLSPP